MGRRVVADGSKRYISAWGKRILVLVSMLLLGGWLGRPLQAEALQQHGGALVPLAFAQFSEAEGTCKPLDLVLLIDQSDSMRYNDPENFRIIVTRHLLRILMTDLVTTCPDTAYQIAVVEFGDKAVTRLGPVNLAQLRGTDLHASLAKLDGLLEKHGLGDNYDYVSRYMGRTDHGAAFLEAAQDLNIMAQGREDTEVQRAVVLLTDGWPCVGSWGCSVEHDTMDRQAYMRYLSTEVIPKLPENTGIWIVALNDKTPYLKTVGDAFQQIAQSHHGKLESLRYNKAYIATQMHKVFQEITGRHGQIVGCGEALRVPPYLGMVTLYIYKETSVTSEVRFWGGKYRLQAGQSVGGTNAIAFSGMIDYHADKGGASEVYSFFAPPGGIWRITNAEGKCEKTEVSLQAVSEERGLFGVSVYAVGQKQPLGEEHWPRCVQCDQHFSDPANPFKPDFRVQITLKKTTGEAIQEYLTQWQKVPSREKSCALHLQMVVVAPDGKETIIPLEADKDDFQVWHLTQPLPVSEEATSEHPYRVFLEGEGPSISKEGECVFDAKNKVQVLAGTKVFTYTTSAVPVLHFELSKPGENASVPVWQPISLLRLKKAPVDVLLQIKDENGKVIPPGQVFSKGDLQVEVISQEGTRDILLKEGEEGYSAQLEFSQARSEKVCLKIHVNNEAYNRQAFYFPSEEREKEVCFQRRGALEPVFFYGKWVLILAVLALAGMYWGLVIQPFGGHLELRQGGGEPVVVDLNVGRLRLFPHVTKRLAGEGLGVRKVVVRHSGPGRIQVEVVRESGEREECILSPGEAEYLDDLQIKWMAAGMMTDNFEDDLFYGENW